MEFELVNVNVKITGISPLLMHRFSEEGLEPKKSTRKSTKQTTDDVHSYLYQDKKCGTIYQPSTHIIATLKKGGARFQIPGQGKLTYKNMMGSGVVICIPDEIPHLYPEWEVDTRSVVIGRARVMRSRPVFKKWALEFELEIDEMEVPNDVVKEILEYSGKRVGIGDFRPEKGGSFGRFEVSKWKILKK